MATEINGGQAEAAPVSSTPATAQPEVQAGATTIATPAQLAEAEREFEDFYSSEPSASAAPSGEATVEPAQTDETQTAEPSPGGEQPVEVQTPPEESPGDINAPDKLRVRLSHDDDIAIAAIQRARKLSSFGEAAKVYYSLVQPAAAAPAPATIPGLEPGQVAPVVPAEPPASAGIAAQVQALAAEIKAEREGDGYLNPEHLEKVDRLADLKSDLRFAKADEARLAREAQARTQAQSQTAAADFNVQWTANAEQVNAANPDLANPKSVLHSMAALARREMTEAKDPRLSLPTGPQAILEVALAKMKDMGLSPAPAATAAPAAATAPVPPSPAAPAARRVAPAPGARGQQNGGQPPSFAAAVAAASDPKEADRLFDEAAESGLLTAALRRR